MRYSKVALSLAVSIVLVGCVSSSEGGGPVVTPPPSAPGVTENNTFAGLLNDVRVANGAGDVAFDARLGVAAQMHANDMLENNFFSHTGSDGGDVGDRATTAGYNWVVIGENLAQGASSQQEAIDDWTASPGHHANNIDPRFEDFGLARAGEGSNQYWVLVLGKE